MCLPSRNGAFDAIKSRMACSALLPCALRAAVELMALSQPPNFRLQITPVILKVPTISPHYVQYNRVRGSSAKRGPRQDPAERSCWGEEESPKGISSGHSGTTELLPRKAKRRMWSLRRRGVSFFDIFLHAKKDIAHGGPDEKRMPVKTYQLTSLHYI